MDTSLSIRRLLLVHSELDLGDGLPEEFALGRANLELKCGRLTGAVRTSEGTGAPRRSWGNG